MRHLFRYSSYSSSRFFWWGLLLTAFYALAACRTTKGGTRFLSKRPWCSTSQVSTPQSSPHQDSVFERHTSLNLDRKPVLTFPLRIVEVIGVSTAAPRITKEAVQTALQRLNTAFEPAHLRFEAASVQTLSSSLLFESLSDNQYQTYFQFSAQHDTPDTITLYLFDYNSQFCKQTATQLSCYRKSGFALVLSSQTNNVVLSKFDWTDAKIIVHEFGHFFGLEHTFESQKYGTEKVDGSNCATAGDRICDTPADPSALFEVHVHYTDCEMKDLYEAGTHLPYKPLIENYMSYYDNCYMRPYSFTPDQLRVLYAAAQSPIRTHLRKPR